MEELRTMLESGAAYFVLGIAAVVFISGVCLVLLLLLHRAVETTAAIRELRAALVELKAERPAAQAAATEAAAQAPVGLEPGVRRRIERLSRQGSSPQQIAGNLHLSRGVVDLLLRVQEVQMKAQGQSA
ncbi:MAG: hypothetical protein HYR60_19255 [Acidobacteria bacterium]|nr:hypothetical protein [Acidobacteriota bacterium]MBI3472017.1 hypothetical protein [Candidatus Solibacter usitatus]